MLWGGKKRSRDTSWEAAGQGRDDSEWKPRIQDTNVETDLAIDDIHSKGPRMVLGF